jgi:class 3 adenylate cyclase
MTFFFTDLENSTECWERFPEEMKRFLIRHFDEMATIVEAHGGRIFKTVGDACLAAFECPVEAVRAAFEAQRMLSTADWASLECKRLKRMKVRMGLHTGPANVFRDDYLGPEVCRTARIVEAGHGGQILLSDTTRKLVRGHLPEGSVLLDKGVHRLKHLMRPERIFQLSAPELPQVRRPLRTVLRLDRPPRHARPRSRENNLNKPREGLYGSLNEAIGHN